MKFSVFYRSPFFFRCVKVYIKINAHFFVAKFMLQMEIVQKLSVCAYKVLVRTYNTQIFKENENICKILEMTMMMSWDHKPYDVNSAFQPGSNLTEMWGFFLSQACFGLDSEEATDWHLICCVAPTAFTACISSCIHIVYPCC